VQCPRYRFSPRRACLLLAAGLVLAGRDAVAQTALIVPDTLAPRLDCDPNSPPRFEPANQPAQPQTRFQPAVAPPASGAGVTGFDSTNVRKKTKVKRKPGATASALRPVLGMAATSVAPAPSPYQIPQIPPSGDADKAPAAATPGGPPVEKIGPIRKPPKKRKAHEEPENPYAPLGIRAGAFDLFPAVELIGGHDTNPGQSTDAKGA